MRTWEWLPARTEEFLGDEPEKDRTPHWEHAKAVWESEEENARRLATRRALIVGIPLAAAAFSRQLTGPAGIVIAGIKHDEPWAYLCTTFSAITGFFMFAILVKVFPIRRTRKRPYRSSSDALSPIRKKETMQADIDEFLDLSDENARVASITRILRAAHKLNGQNVRLAQRQQYALEYVAWALLSCILAGLTYIGIGSPADKATEGQAVQATEREN